MRAILKRRSRVKLRSENVQILSITLILILLMLCLSIFTDTFLRTGNILNILKQVSLTALLSVGFTFVLITGGIDLSLGNVLGMCGVLAALVLSSGHGAFRAILAALAAGTAFGTFNGFIGCYLRIPPFIATLGTLFIAKGITFTITRGYPIYKGVEGAFLFLGQGYVGPIPFPVILAVAGTALAHFALKYTTYGRRLYAIGGNREAARLMGIRVRLLSMSTYAIAGFAAALTGVMFTARMSSGQPDAGGFATLLDAATAAILGGTTLSGGRGSVLGTLIGALLLGVIANGLTLLGVTFQWQMIIKGILLLLALAVTSVREILGSR